MGHRVSGRRGHHDLPQDEQSTEVLLKNADVATYNVKKSDPGHFQFFTSAL